VSVDARHEALNGCPVLANSLNLIARVELEVDLPTAVERTPRMDAIARLFADADEQFSQFAILEGNVAILTGSEDLAIVLPNDTGWILAFR